MRVLLTSEARFERTPDGTVWGPPAYGRGLWTRYLEAFSAVLILGRVADVAAPTAGCTKASMPDVEFWPLPAYRGLGGLAGELWRIRRRITAAVHRADAIIVRAPSPVAYLASRAAAAAGRPFGAEIVGDASEVFSPGAFHHPLRILLRIVASTMQRRIARDAAAVLYVTRSALQRRYPSNGRTYAAADVALDDAAFECDERRDWNPAAPFVLVTVGGLEQPYKGTSILLQAMHHLRKKDLAVRLRVVGSGRLMTSFRRQCERLGLGGDVEFLGQQDRAGVCRTLDSAQLFVLPSLTEGLPRALLEAMARGLPAVASNVGGIPELLAPECLVPPRDPRALAARIEQLLADAVARRRIGDRNRAHARRYHERWQHAVRKEFLNAVKCACAPAAREVRCA